MSATSMAGRVMNADGGRGRESGRGSTASVPRWGWRPSASVARTGADTLRDLQILMAEQKLDGAQVGTGFEQMRGPGMANQVRRNGLAKTTLLRRFGARNPYRLVADGLLVIAMQS